MSEYTKGFGTRFRAVATELKAQGYIKSYKDISGNKNKVKTLATFCKDYGVNPNYMLFGEGLMFNPQEDFLVVNLRVGTYSTVERYDA